MQNSKDSRASGKFAKGEVDEEHMFLAPQLRDGAFWYTEKIYLEVNKLVTEIIPHPVT
ncbi:MAG: hypothetical protein WBO44_03050 [Saprospiraceae bacterium]